MKNISLANKISIAGVIVAIAAIVASITFNSTVQPQVQANNHTVINGNPGVLTIINQTGFTLQEHQKAIELEKMNAENRLRFLYGNQQQSDHAEIVELKNRINVLESALRSIQADKAILAESLAVYQKKFGSLVSINVQKDNLKKYPARNRDIIAIEMSKEMKNIVLSEVLANKDNKRLMCILEILIRDTDSMDDKERTYWNEKLPTIKFEQQFRLLDILATERQKLASLEKFYQTEIMDLNDKHLKEWAELQTRKKDLIPGT